MNRDEFTLDVTLGAKEITATAVYPDGSNYDSDPVAPDLSTLPTIKVLQAWLGRWGAFSTLALREKEYRDTFDKSADFAGLPVRGTVGILGQHLYNLAFPKDVNSLFLRARAAARQVGKDLRIQLHIQDTSALDDSNADSWLSTLPWEFMRHPDGFFLAAEEELVLSRFLKGNDQRLSMPKTSLPHKILWITTVPEDEQFRDSREATKDVAADLGQAVPPEAMVVTAKRGWPPGPNESDESVFKDKNIIHIAGVSRPLENGRMEINLPNVSEGQSEHELVSTLRRAQGENSVEKPLQLVVLHLLESNPYDYTATFGDHARALVRAGIPAVLAMQYPMSIEHMQPFVMTFYKSLSQDEPRALTIDQSVRAARQSLYRKSGAHERFFGAPVLYLQTKDGVLVDVERRAARQSFTAGRGAGSALRPSWAVPRPRVRDVEETNRSAVAEQLLGIARKTVTNVRSHEVIAAWLDSVDWSGMTSDAAIRTVRDRMSQDDSGGLHDPAYTAMILYLLDQGDRLGT